jgi:hypothetical protein
MRNLCTYFGIRERYIHSGNNKMRAHTSVADRTFGHRIRGKRHYTLVPARASSGGASLPERRLAAERRLHVRDRARGVEQLRRRAREERQPLADRVQALLHLRQHTRDVARNERVLQWIHQETHWANGAPRLTVVSSTSDARWSHQIVVENASSSGEMSPMLPDS